MKIKDVSWPSNMVRMAAEDSRCELIKCCVVDGALQVFITKDFGMLHMSVSHQTRYPTWNELKHLRYALLPNDCTMAILFPPMEQYVNVHQNCFHLHEIPPLHE